MTKNNESSHLQEDIEKIEIALLLEGIYRHYGYDFRNYSFQSIRRRIMYRMQGEKLNSILGLLDKVLHERKAMERLFADFSINVTEMFREPSFFLAFRKKSSLFFAPFPPFAFGMPVVPLEKKYTPWPFFYMKKAYIISQCCMPRI